MASSGPDEKRPRYASWSGPSQPHAHPRGQHQIEIPPQYSNNPLPPLIHPAVFHEGDHRGLPDTSLHPYQNHAGYPTTADNVSAHYPPEQAFARANGMHTKSRSPPDFQPHHPMRTPPVSTPGEAGGGMMSGGAPPGGGHAGGPPHGVYPMETTSSSPYHENQSSVLQQSNRLQQTGAGHPSNAVHSASDMNVSGVPNGPHGLIVTSQQVPDGHPASTSHAPTIGRSPSVVPQPNGGLHVGAVSPASAMQQVPGVHSIDASNHSNRPPQGLHLVNTDPVPANVYRPSQSPMSAGIPTPAHFWQEQQSNGQVLTTYPGKRKAIRAAQACDACRQRKAKCDEGRPACGFCKESSMQCVYRDVPPPKQDRTMMQMMQKLDEIHRSVQDLHTVFPGGSSSARTSSVVTDVPKSEEFSPGLAPAPTLTGSVDTTQLTLSPERLDAAVAVKTEPPPKYGEMSIPMEHTTAAHKLLRWPSIRKMLAHRSFDENYVMNGEEERGLLRVFGRGEGNDYGELTDIMVPERSGQAEGSPSTSHPADNLWGFGSFVTGETRRSEAIGGLHPDGTLRLDSLTIMHLVEVYVANIHIMHPFMDKEKVWKMVLQFAQLHNAGESQARSPYSNAGTNPPEIRREPGGSGLKRKRSSAGTSTSPRTWPEKSVGTALILLIMALGKICEHTDFLPGPVPVSGRPTAVGSSSQTSSPSSSFNSGQPQDETRRPPPKDHPSQLRNVDIIPGLAYYAYATDILGNSAGGNSLAHVQAYLLAGLYVGQLGRVMESWKWINNACTACLILVRPSRFQQEPESVQNVITTAFWTCLQLESDIVAELDLLPQSGIQRKELEMGFPRGTEAEELMWMYYLAQLALRTLLNRVHASLYKPADKNPRIGGWSKKELAELDYQLGRWRETLPEPLKWDDDDPPPAEINAARLRAKYYGARYVIHRPWLHHAIHPNLSRPTTTGEGSDEGATPPSQPPSEDVLEACVKCIDSAMKSTMAFHGISQRPIVTNIFGTAHAQFGNCLVLSVCIQDPHMHHLVPESEYTSLVTKTITFLRKLAPISPTLKNDAVILEHTLAETTLALKAKAKAKAKATSVSPSSSSPADVGKGIS